MSQYTPKSAPTLKGLDVATVWKELQEIRNALETQQIEYSEYKVHNNTPDKPRVGRVYYADGTNWNPSNGEGLYLYTGSAWQSLTPTTGVWTPVLTDGVNNATMGTQVGEYSRVGDLVTITGRIATTSLGSVSGAIYISGLPFTASSTTNARYSVHTSFGTGLAITGGDVVSGHISANGTIINLNLWTVATGTTAMTHAEWTANGQIYFSGSYQV